MSNKVPFENETQAVFLDALHEPSTGELRQAVKDHLQHELGVVPENWLTKKQVTGLLRSLDADPGDLRGVLNVIACFDAAGDSLLAVVHEVDKAVIQDQLITAGLLLLLKPMLETAAPNFHVPLEWTDARLTGRYGSNPRFTAWFHNAFTPNDVHSLMQCHLHCFLQGQTGVKPSTEYAWAERIRKAGELVALPLLHQLEVTLAGRTSSKAIHDALVTLHKAPNDLDKKLIDQLRQFFKAAKNKKGRHRTDEERQGKTQKGISRKGRGARQSAPGPFAIDAPVSADASGNEEAGDDEPAVPGEGTRKGVERVAKRFGIKKGKLLKSCKGQSGKKKRKSKKSNKKNKKNKKKGWVRKFRFKPVDDPQVLKHVRDYGCIDGEFEDKEGLAIADQTGFNTRCYSEAEYIKEVGHQRIARRRAEVLSPNSMERLDEYDLAVYEEHLIAPLLEEADDPFVLQLLAILDMTLLTMRDVSQILKTTYKNQPPAPDDRIIHPVYVPSEKRLYLPATFSVHVNPKSMAGTEAAEPIAGSIPIPVSSRLKARLDAVCALNGPVPQRKQKRLFPESLGARVVKGLIKKLLRRLNKKYGSELRLSRLKDYLYREAAANPQIDRLRGCYLRGELDYFSQVHATYVSISVQSLLVDYATLYQGLPACIGKGEVLAADLPESHAYRNRRIGSRLTPRLETMQAFVNTLRPTARPVQKQSLQQQVQLSNEWAVYTGYWLGFESCYRVTKDFLSNAEDLNRETRTASVTEKDFDEMPHARVVVFSQKALAQYDRYRNLQTVQKWQRLSEAHMSGQNDAALYVPSDKRAVEKAARRRQPVRIGLMAQGRWMPFGMTHFNGLYQEVFPLPANAHRHFVASRAHESRLPMVTVMAMMGHVSFGLGPFSRFSRYRFTQHRQLVDAFMGDLVERVGFRLLDETEAAA